MDCGTTKPDTMECIISDHILDVHGLVEEPVNTNLESISNNSRRHSVTKFDSSWSLTWPCIKRGADLTRATMHCLPENI